MIVRALLKLLRRRGCIRWNAPREAPPGMWQAMESQPSESAPPVRQSCSNATSTEIETVEADWRTRDDGSNVVRGAQVAQAQRIGKPALGFSGHGGRPADQPAGGVFDQGG